MLDVNVLVRGQSNALLFADRGGAAALEHALEAKLGHNVNVLAQWGDPNGLNTINAATAFMDWDRDGETAGLIKYLNNLPEDIQNNPTVTLWMHNEYDQQGSFTAAEWASEVRVDATLVRAALGQDASTTPYLFTYVPYPYGQNGDAIREGMAQLAADPTFNASLAPSLGNLTMDGDGFPGSSHMGNSDTLVVGARLAPSLAEILAPLGAGSDGPAVPQESDSGPPGQPSPTLPPQQAVAPDWNAIAAQVTAHFEATGHWFL